MAAVLFALGESRSNLLSSANVEEVEVVREGGGGGGEGRGEGALSVAVQSTDSADKPHVDDEFSSLALDVLARLARSPYRKLLVPLFTRVLTVQANQKQHNSHRQILINFCVCSAVCERRLLRIIFFCIRGSVRRVIFLIAEIM